MPDRIEEILKKIHVMFAKCEPYRNSPDRVVISKGEMFELLEELNEALYEVMDQYEATARSREKARLEMDRRAAEIVAAAKQDSDDVHAATLLYTDKMLNEVKDVIERSKENVKREMIELMAQLEMQQDTLDENRNGVKDELKEIHDSEMYLELLEKVRKRDEQKKKFGIDTPDEDDIFEENPKAGAASNLVIRVNKPGENSGITYSSKKNRKNSSKKASSGKQPAPAETEDGELPAPSNGVTYTADDFDLDAEYEQWKEEQEGTGEQPKKKGGLLSSLFGMHE